TRGLGREEVEVGFAQKLRQRSLETYAIAFVAEGDVSVAILAKDVLRQGLDQRLVEGLRIAQLAFDALMFGDIVTNQDAALERAGAFAQRPAGYADPQTAGRIRMSHEQLYAVERLAAHAARHRKFGQDRRPIRLIEREIPLQQAGPK